MANLDLLFGGYDHSLTAPGVCVMDVDGNVHTLQTIRTGSRRGWDRIEHIVAVTAAYFSGVVAINIEDYAHGANERGNKSNAEGRGIVKWELNHRRGIPIVQKIGPSTLKKYLTGHGRAEKRAMIEAVRSGGIRCLDDNQADAYALALILRDAWAWVHRGEKPSTLYRLRVIDDLATHIKTQGGVW